MIKLKIDTNRLEMILNDFELRIAGLENKRVKEKIVHITDAELMRVIDISAHALAAAEQALNNNDVPFQPIALSIIAKARLKIKKLKGEEG